MKCEMYRCCCFNNSKDASFASGIYTTIISLFSIIYFAITEIMSPAQKDAFTLPTNPVASIISLVLMILFLILSLVLLYGVAKTKRFALIPWMVWMIIVITSECIGIILLIVVVIKIAEPLLLIYLLLALPFIGLNITCFIVVKTHYQTLSAAAVSVDEESINYLSLKN